MDGDYRVVFLTEVVDKDSGGLDEGKDGVFLELYMVWESALCNFGDERFWEFILVDGVCELLLLDLGGKRCRRCPGHHGCHASVTARPGLLIIS